jgi:hypothetical protein
MRTTTIFAIGFVSFTAIVVGCGDETTSSTTSGPSGPGVTSGGGDGGSMMNTGGSASDGGGPGSGGNPGVGGAGGIGVDPCTMETTQLLINELGTQGSNAEFVEIHNAGANAVDLSLYYLSDNSIYHSIAAGVAWAPMGTPNTDFLMGFPAGATIDAGGYITIEFGTDFEGAYAGACPTYTVRDNVICNGAAVPKVSVPTNGGVPNNPGNFLSNAGEMLMLFCWGGGPRVYDVDYLLWDDTADANTHVDKSAVAGYVADTAPASQAFSPQPGIGESIGRCDTAEDGETMAGGNGLLGHDETSENFAITFPILASPSPGAANTCN